MTDNDLLELAAALALRAAEAILAVRARGFDVQRKTDASPVTVADTAAEAIIVAGLRGAVPEIAVIAEEEVAAGRITAPSHEYWLVDPLDGTREFLSRNGQFTVNIALIDSHVPVLGVVHVPVTDVSYRGLPGAGAWRVAAGEAARAIRVSATSAAPLRVVGSRSHRGDSLDAFLARLGPHELVPMGSSLKFCLVAEGSADVYPRLGPTSEWDTAAAHAVLAGAGGTVVDLGGAPLRYNTKAQLLNPFFVAYGPSDHDWLQLLAA